MGINPRTSPLRAFASALHKDELKIKEFARKKGIGQEGKKKKENIKKINEDFKSSFGDFGKGLSAESNKKQTKILSSIKPK